MAKRRPSAAQWVAFGLLAVIGLAAVSAVWAASPYWQVVAALLQTLTNVGLLAVTYTLWQMESKRDQADLTISVVETEQSLYKESHLRVQIEVANKGLRATAIEFAEMRLSGPIGDTGWKKVNIQLAHEPRDPELMVISGAKKRMEVYWHDIYKSIPREALVNLDVKIRITPVIGEPRHADAPKYKAIA